MSNFDDIARVILYLKWFIGRFAFLSALTSFLAENFSNPTNLCFNNLAETLFLLVIICSILSGFSGSNF